jgi:flagellar protein FlhE
MINKVKFSKARCALLGMASALVLFSEVSLAGAYQSSVQLPTVHSRGHTYQAHLPVTGAAPAGARVSRVSWNWAYVGFPQGLIVSLCQGTIYNCENVSRQRSGSTSRFLGANPTQPLFFTVHVINDPQRRYPVPVAGLNGSVTVVW